MAANIQKITVTTNTYTSPRQTRAVKFNFMHVVYTSDANAGNRQLRAALYNGADELIWDSHAGEVQAANNVYDYEWMPGVYREGSFIDDAIQVPFPKDMEASPGFYFKVFDATDVSVLDSMVITIQTKYVDELYNS